MKLYRSESGQRVGQIDEIGIHEIRALVHDQRLVRRRRPEECRDRIGIAVIELIGVVVADRDHGNAGVERLQFLQQAGRRFRLGLTFGAHPRTVAADKLDVDERPQVIDDDDDPTWVEA